MKQDVSEAWRALVANLDAAGQAMAAATEALPDPIRADGYRALVRALSNQLSRLEFDEACPELIAYNLARDKFYMDNPDYRYWVADLPKGGVFRIDGRAAGASFVSINAYAGTRLQAETVARLTSDELDFDDEGAFAVTLGGSQAEAQGQWLAIPEGANMVWVRLFYDAPPQREEVCSITRLDRAPPTAVIDPDLFSRRLATMGSVLGMASKVIAAGAGGLPGDHPNTVREWSEMQGGAVYTEPGIHYQRGAWDLGEDEALVIEGRMVAARHMNILLYSPFLNSLDYRTRTVSLTAAQIKTDAEGRFRIVLAGKPPRAANWLDTEGRRKGLFVIRWLQPEATPPLPLTRVVRLAEAGDA